MGKAKKLKLQRAAIKPNARKTNANAKPKPADPSPKAKQNSHSIPPTIPFDPEDRILLIGEGPSRLLSSPLMHCIIPAQRCKNAHRLTNRRLLICSLAAHASRVHQPISHKLRFTLLTTLQIPASRRPRPRSGSGRPESALRR